MKVKYKCTIEFDLDRDTTGFSHDVVERYKKRLDDTLEEELEEALRSTVVEENDTLKIERNYLTFDD